MNYLINDKNMKPGEISVKFLEENQPFLLLNSDFSISRGEEEEHQKNVWLNIFSRAGKNIRFSTK